MSATPIDAGDFILLHRHGPISRLIRKLTRSHWDCALPICLDGYGKLVVITPILGKIMAIPLIEFVNALSGMAQLEFVGTNLASGTRFVGNSYLYGQIGTSCWRTSGAHLVTMMLLMAGYPGLPVDAELHPKELAIMFGVEPR